MTTFGILLAREECTPAELLERARVTADLTRACGSHVLPVLRG